MKQSFFHHTAMETAISNGWDFKQDLVEFYEQHEDKEKILSRTVWEVKGCIVTEEDVLYASKGAITEAMYIMFSTYLAGVKPSSWGIVPSPTVLVSMHSGSSDYLFLKDVKGLVDEYEGVGVE